MHTYAKICILTHTYAYIRELPLSIDLPRLVTSIRVLDFTKKQTPQQQPEENQVQTSAKIPEEQMPDGPTTVLIPPVHPNPVVADLYKLFRYSHIHTIYGAAHYSHTCHTGTIEKPNTTHVKQHMTRGTLCTNTIPTTHKFTNKKTHTTHEFTLKNPHTTYRDLSVLLETKEKQEKIHRNFWATFQSEDSNTTTDDNNISKEVCQCIIVWWGG